MKNKFYLTMALFLACTITAMAQAPGFDTSVDDVTAPLPGIILAAVIALGIGVRKSLKK